MKRSNEKKLMTYLLIKKDSLGKFRNILQRALKQLEWFLNILFHLSFSLSNEISKNIGK